MTLLSSSDPLPAFYLLAYRRLFGLNLLLEQLYFSNTVIHVIYEKWEPCFIPAFRSLQIPVTHYLVDLALYCGMTLSLFFIFDQALVSPRWNQLVSIALFLNYSFLRIINYYSWNNHYYVNILLLAMFMVIPGTNGGSSPTTCRPRWQYSVIQIFFGIVYFMAGISKISSAWMDGSITESMIMSHKIILPNIMMYAGGFALDFFGGLIVIADVLMTTGIPRTVTRINHLNLLFFHAHNLVYMFSSIQFFPLHMLFTIVLFLPAELGLDKWRNSNTPLREEIFQISNPVDGITKHQLPATTTSSKRFSRSAIYCWCIVLGQFIFSVRRFYFLCEENSSIPNIMAINDAAEYHSQFHHFGWRMKSKTISNRINIKGKGALTSTVGISHPGELLDSPEKTKYMHPRKVFYGGDIDDIECAIHPMVNRMKKLKPLFMNGHEPEDVVVNLFMWQEINGGSFQLLVNPDLNFIHATYLPFFSPPDWDYIERRAEWFMPNWMDRFPEHAIRAFQKNMTLIPFSANARPSRWIPNPLISSETEGLQPSWIVCVMGKIVLRVFDGATTECEEGQAFILPEDGKFHMKYYTDSLFALAFDQKGYV